MSQCTPYSLELLKDEPDKLMAAIFAHAADGDVTYARHGRDTIRAATEVNADTETRCIALYLADAMVAYAEERRGELSLQRLTLVKPATEKKEPSQRANARRAPQ